MHLFHRWSDWETVGELRLRCRNGVPAVVTVGPVRELGGGDADTTAVILPAYHIQVRFCRVCSKTASRRVPW